MKVQITNAMLMAFVMNLLFCKAIGLTQGVMAREGENDMWVATLFAIVQGLAMMFVTVVAVRRIPGKDLIEHASVLFGKWLGKLAGIIAFVFFLGSYIVLLITFVFHMRDYFLPGYPLLVFVLAAVVIPLYAVFHGLEVTGRLAMVGVFAIIILNLLVLSGSFNAMDVKRLLPVFETGVWNTVATSRHADTDFAMATMTAAMILPFVKDQKVWWKASAGGILFGGLLVLLWPLIEVGTLSARETGHYILACMQMARSAEIGLFIHRYEMIMVAFFAFSLFVQLMMAVYCASISAAHTLGVANYKKLVVPVSISLGAVGYWVVSDQERAMRVVEQLWPPIALPIAFGLPIVILLAGWVFRGRLLAAK